MVFPPINFTNVYDAFPGKNAVALPEVNLAIDTHVWCLLHFISILCKHWLLWPKIKTLFLSRERWFGIRLPISHSMTLIWLQVTSAPPVLSKKLLRENMPMNCQKAIWFWYAYKTHHSSGSFFSGMHLTVGMEKLCCHPITSWTLFCHLCPGSWWLFTVTSWCSHGLEGCLGATDFLLYFLMHVPLQDCNHRIIHFGKDLQDHRVQALT